MHLFIFYFGRRELRSTLISDRSSPSKKASLIFTKCHRDGHTIRTLHYTKVQLLVWESFSRYVTSRPDLLSLAITPWVGAIEHHLKE